MQTKFEMSSFIRSKDGLGQKNVEMGHVTMTTPNWGIVRHHQANTSCGQQEYEILSL